MKRKAVIVLGILASIWLILPEPSTVVQETARKRQTESSAQNLRSAIKNYFVEYSVYPLEEGEQGRDTAVESPLESDEIMMDVMLGNDDILNPRKLSFGEWRDAGKSKKNGLLSQGGEGSGILVDSWGQPFYIALDGNYDNKIDNPDKENSSTRTLRQTILVWSGGPDADVATWEDNIKTW